MQQNKILLKTISTRWQSRIRVLSPALSEWFRSTGPQYIPS